MKSVILAVGSIADVDCSGLSTVPLLWAVLVRCSMSTSLIQWPSVTPEREKIPEGHIIMVELGFNAVCQNYSRTVA